MLPLLSFLHPFGDRPLHTFVHAGRPFWVARHLDTHLGAGEGTPPLPQRMLAEWGEAFAHAYDFAFVQGAALLALQAALAAMGQPAGTGQRGLVLVVYETGLALALDRVGTSAARELRRFIIDGVLPDLRRNAGRIALSALSPRVLRYPPDPPQARRRPRPPFAAPFQSTLARRVDLEDRRFQVEALRRVAEEHRENLDPGAALALDLVCAEVATGLNLLPLFRPEEGASDPPERDPDPTDRDAA